MRLPLSFYTVLFNKPSYTPGDLNESVDKAHVDSRDENYKQALEAAADVYISYRSAQVQDLAPLSI